MIFCVLVVFIMGTEELAGYVKNRQKPGAFSPGSCSSSKDTGYRELSVLIPNHLSCDTERWLRVPESH
jgi:hypothetical protein